MLMLNYLDATIKFLSLSKPCLVAEEYSVKNTCKYATESIVERLSVLQCQRERDKTAAFKADFQNRTKQPILRQYKIAN